MFKNIILSCILFTLLVSCKKENHSIQPLNSFLLDSIATNVIYATGNKTDYDSYKFYYDENNQLIGYKHFNVKNDKTIYLYDQASISYIDNVMYIIGTHKSYTYIFNNDGNVIKEITKNTSENGIIDSVIYKYNNLQQLIYRRHYDIAINSNSYDSVYWVNGNNIGFKQFLISNQSTIVNNWEYTFSGTLQNQSLDETNLFPQLKYGSANKNILKANYRNGDELYNYFYEKDNNGLTTKYTSKDIKGNYYYNREFFYK